MDKTYQIQLTSAQIDLLGTALFQLPYGQVAELIEELKRQVSLQNQPEAEEKESDD